MHLLLTLHMLPTQGNINQLKLAIPPIVKALVSLPADVRMQEYPNIPILYHPMVQPRPPHLMNER